MQVYYSAHLVFMVEHSKHYIRHVQMNTEGEVVQLFSQHIPEMVENSVWSANGSDIAICFPCNNSRR